MYVVFGSSLLIESTDSIKVTVKSAFSMSDILVDCYCCLVSLTRPQFSGTCTILLIADEGPRTVTSDSMKLLIHATTS